MFAQTAIATPRTMAVLALIESPRYCSYTFRRDHVDSCLVTMDGSELAKRETQQNRGSPNDCC